MTRMGRMNGASDLAVVAVLTMLLMAAFHGTGVDAAFRLWIWLKRRRQNLAAEPPGRKRI